MSGQDSVVNPVDTGSSGFYSLVDKISDQKFELRAEQKKNEELECQQELLLAKIKKLTSEVDSLSSQLSSLELDSSKQEKLYSDALIENSRLREEHYDDLKVAESIAKKRITELEGSLAEAEDLAGYYKRKLSEANFELCQRDLAKKRYKQFAYTCVGLLFFALFFASSS